MSSRPGSGGGTSARRVTIHDLAALRERRERFVMLTAYDASSAGILDELDVPVILVGDSLGMVVLGHTTTLPVTLDDMIHHARAVMRARPRALVVVDLPFGSYQQGPDQALASAVRVIKESGADAVKLEGGERVAPSVRALVAAGIPVMGHLGLTPQSVGQFGGFRVQGRDADAAAAILADAVTLGEAGAFATVLECIPASLAARITAVSPVPTIGIGAGPDVDGQVLVWHDLLGLGSGTGPRFVRRYADLRATIATAVTTFRDDVRSGDFPSAAESYGD
jgi:3-methyl-2-oxobutanoate hydroxymethyltransferase